MYKRKSENSPLENQAWKMLTDLQDHYLDFLTEREVDFVEYNDLEQNYGETFIIEPFFSILNSVDDLLKELDYKSFVDWGFEYYGLDNDKEWINEWSRESLEQVYQYLKKMEVKNENNG